MPRLLCQSAHSADDRIGIQGVLVVVAVVAVVAGSLSIASKLDPLLRRLAPDPASHGQGRPARSTEPVVVEALLPMAVPPAAVDDAEGPPAPVPALAIAPVLAPIAAPASPPVPQPRPVIARRESALGTASPSSTLPRTVSPPPPRPAQSAQRPPNPPVALARESHRQVARNARNSQRARQPPAQDPYIGAMAAGLGANALVAEARRYLGTNPTNMARLWCARFMNYVLKRAGYEGTGSDAALSFARYGRRISGPRIGAIAVMRRKGGGHVGIVSGIDRNGNPILISGNTPNRRGGRIVAERVYPRGRIIAYVMPR